ncbi:MAG: hypothetical protein GY838_01455 [bacterium]|nr:hypothetical protein [bacterium]
MQPAFGKDVPFARREGTVQIRQVAADTLQSAALEVLVTVASGVYFYRLVAGDFRSIRAVTLLK